MKSALAGAPIVTITGPGGVGKTRLALQVAHRTARSFPGGVWFVELADVTDPAAIALVIAESMKIADQSSTDTVGVVLRHLSDRRALVILDNCEHLVDAVAGLASALVKRAPDLRIILTSREPLAVAGEHVVSVPPLSVPEPGEGGRGGSEAVELFEQRASAASPGFVVDVGNADDVARLCRRLDGIPLAIELAAVQVRNLSIPEIVHHLESSGGLLTAKVRGVDVRHQTIEAAMRWSYDLCTPGEQQIWVRLSYFNGSFTLDSAVSICAFAGVDDSQARESILGLISKSVIDRLDDGDRYRLLEPIRQFGRRLLSPPNGEHAVDESELAARHLRHYAEVVAVSERMWRSGTGQIDAANSVMMQMSNIRQAIRTGFDRDIDARKAGEIVTGLWHRWISGLAREGQYWFDRVLTSPAELSAKTLWLKGWIALAQGDPQAAVPVLAEAADRSLTDGDRVMTGYVTQAQASAAMFTGRLEESARLYEEAVSIFDSLQLWDAVHLLALAQQSWIHLVLGDLERSRALASILRRRSDEIGEVWALSWGQWVSAVDCWKTGELNTCADLLRRSLRSKRALSDLTGIAFALEVFGWLECDRRNWVHAAQLFGANRSIWGPIGNPLFGFDQYLDMHHDYSVLLEEELGIETFDAELARGATMTVNEVLDLILSQSGREVRDRGRTHPDGARGAKEGRNRGRPKATGELTPREWQVAALIAEGASNAQVASDLVIAPRTAETHVENILVKLGFTSRSQVAGWYYEHRELDT
ncbi:LuxR C-terminal-related transcriptional regulator [Gordonia rhizosphera]|uniref:LuxR C-terminal-related transcriptional regulator n=1 Tax=Gordonia rhizosphera TaxID=83341 RepID=UPI0003197EE2|nr:LuxR C-terminal-related transcriptional regulator [Gordonia rhizosphera]